MTLTRDAAYQLLALGRPEEALQHLAFDPEDAWSWHLRASALLALGRHAEAASAAQEGLAIDAEHVYLLDALAAARIGLEDYAGAEKAILAALHIDAEDPDLLTRYAHVVAVVGQIEKAEKLIARALAIDPENTFALQMHALLATAQNDRARMIERSRELLRVVPESVMGHRLLGAAHADAGRIEDARDQFVRAVRIDPTDHRSAEAAREATAASHWLLWPLRPLHKFGAAPVWISAIGLMFVLRAMKMDTATTVVAVSWVAYCVYSWVAPPIARRLMR